MGGGIVITRRSGVARSYGNGRCSAAQQGRVEMLFGMDRTGEERAEWPRGWNAGKKGCRDSIRVFRRMGRVRRSTGASHFRGRGARYVSPTADRLRVCTGGALIRDKGVQRERPARQVGSRERHRLLVGIIVGHSSLQEPDSASRRRFVFGCAWPSNSAQPEAH